MLGRFSHISIDIQPSFTRLLTAYMAHNLEVFLNDLPKIRADALVDTITKAWSKSGMWPYDGGKKVLRDAAKYIPKLRQPSDLPSKTSATPQSQVKIAQELFQKLTPLMRR